LLRAILPPCAQTITTRPFHGRGAGAWTIARPHGHEEGHEACPRAAHPGDLGESEPQGTTNAGRRYDGEADRPGQVGKSASS